jgi:hypothetical protein
MKKGPPVIAPDQTETRERGLTAVPRVESLLTDRHTAARSLSIGITALDGLLRARAIASVRIGRRKLVVVASLDQYVEELARSAQSG